MNILVYAASCHQQIGGKLKAKTWIDEISITGFRLLPNVVRRLSGKCHNKLHLAGDGGYTGIKYRYQIQVSKEGKKGFTIVYTLLSVQETNRNGKK